MTGAKALELRTDDGLVLAAELAAADGHLSSPVAAVLCHPHPQYGGTMRSLVISVLFDALPLLGCTCLRFDFRGVGDSEGTSSEGRNEPRDVVAAVDVLASAAAPAVIVLVGWSFGADMALSVLDDRVAGWVAIAPPLRFRTSFDQIATDARPKHLVLGEHDEFRAPADVQLETAGWSNTTVAVIPGASHFFIGRTDRVVTDTWAGIERVVSVVN